MESGKLSLAFAPTMRRVRAISRLVLVPHGLAIVTTLAVGCIAPSPGASDAAVDVHAAIDGGIVPHDAMADSHPHDAASGRRVCRDAGDATSADGGSVAGLCSPDGWCLTNPLPAANNFNGVWGSGPDDVWAVGDSGGGNAAIQHWDGCAWSKSSLGTTGDGLPLSGVWGSGPNDVWAVSPGNGGNNGGCLHWNGSKWSNSTSYYGGLAVWGSGPRDVWVVGEYGIISHWNGSAWSSDQLMENVLGNGAPRPKLEGVWGSGSSDVWAVGPAGPGTTMLHWDGIGWALAPFPSMDGGPSTSGIRGIWGRGPKDVWAVGGVIVHWDGSTWSVSTGKLGGSAIWGSGPSDVWAVGGDGILHWNGTAWSLSTSGTPSDELYGVWGSGPGGVWIVGGGGWVLHHA